VSEDKRKEALAFARSVVAASLGTVDGDVPHVRIMQVARVDDDFTVWFSSSASASKMRQIAENPNVCVVFWREATDLKVMGKAEIVADKAAKDALYRPEWDRHYPNGGRDDPNYGVIRVTAATAEFRDMRKYGLAPVNVL
jgi:general stress protein 26